MLKFSHSCLNSSLLNSPLLSGNMDKGEPNTDSQQSKKALKMFSFLFLSTTDYSNTESGKVINEVYHMYFTILFQINSYVNIETACSGKTYYGSKQRSLELLSNSTVLHHFLYLSINSLIFYYLCQPVTTGTSELLVKLLQCLFRFTFHNPQLVKRLSLVSTLVIKGIGTYMPLIGHLHLLFLAQYNKLHLLQI